MWSWTLNPDGRYSVKSTYSYLSSDFPTEGALDGVIL